MRVLFVSAVGTDGKPRAVVRAQGEALRKAEIDISYFCIGGGGLISYLRAIPRLRREVNKVNPDIVHAHYYLSGIVSSLALTKPLVVSLMGSDVNGGLFQQFLSSLFARLSWDVTIVKTAAMKQKLGRDKTLIIPNGVDTTLFYEQDYDESLKVTGLPHDKKTIIFPGNPDRREKNWPMAVKTIEILNRPDVQLTPLHGKPATELPFWYSSASAMLSVSLWEGSPNMVKEAMACNLPLVATPAGDIPWLTDGVKGCKLISYDPHEAAMALGNILDEGMRSVGRKRIFDLELDSSPVSQKIITVYNALCS